MSYDLKIVVTVDVNSEYTMKYICHRLFPPSIAVNIHPVWVIDDYVKILRSDVWFIPLIDPTTTDIRIISKVGEFNF
jgi:hypothetical protein